MSRKNRQMKNDITKRKKKKRHNLLAEFIIITLSIVIIFFALAAGVFIFMFGNIQKEAISSEDVSAVEISDSDNAYTGKEIKNIALFGTDSRENDDSGRSDAIIIASVNTKTGVIKLISIARDTYINIPGYGNTKICHAYAYGGSSLAVKTLNTNFGLDITDFVSVNFDQLTEIVDKLGGIDVEITENERQEFNKVISETTNEKISQSGMVHLNGAQALCYSRIRKGDSDDARTSRQREVLQLLFEKMKKESPLKYPSIVRELMPYVTTSLNTEEIIKLAAVVVTKNPSMESAGMPNEYIEHSGGKIDRVWYYIYDIDTAADMIKEFIYDDIDFSQYGQTDLNPSESS